MSKGLLKAVEDFRQAVQKLEIAKGVANEAQYAVKRAQTDFETAHRAFVGWAAASDELRAQWELEEGV